MKAIDEGKTVAIDAGKNLVETAAKKLTTAKWQVANIMVAPEEITKKINEVIAKYVDTSAINHNKLIDGSSVNRPNATNEIAIQDLVKRLNGSGLKVTYIFFLLSKMIMDELITQSNITPSDYQTLYPLFTFDVSKQKENSIPVLLIFK